MLHSTSDATLKQMKSRMHSYTATSGCGGALIMQLKLIMVNLYKFMGVAPRTTTKSRPWCFTAKPLPRWFFGEKLN